jgi:hypothetical protein
MDYPASFHREILVNEALGEDAHFFRFLYDRKKGAYDSKKIGAPSFERKGNLLSDIRRYLADNKRYRSEISALKTVSYPAIHRNTLVDILCYYDHGIEPMVSDEYSPTRIFPKSQHACLGSGWDKDSVTMWITGKDWLLPSNYARPYSHEDVGNFIITAYGELLIVDAGYDHWASRYFNLAPHHNVILVEGDGQISGPTPTTTGILEDFIATDFLDSVDVSSFYADTSFLRRVLFPGKEYFVIWDKVESSSERSYHWLFHSPIRQGKGQILADNNRVSWPGWDIYNDVPGNARLDIFFASPLKMEPYRESQWIPVASWDYKGTFRESIKASKAGTSTTLLTALYPYPTGGATPSFKRVEVERGEGIVVHTLKGDIDIILSQGGDGTLKAQGLKTDAAVLFLRKTDSGNGFQFFSMYDGKTLELNGKEIIKSQEGITVALRVQHQGALEGWMIPKADGHGFRIKFYVFGRRPECVLLDGRQIPFEYETGSDYIEINMEPGYGPCDIKVLLESL